MSEQQASGQVSGSTIARQVAKALADLEVPVPEGHKRRRKGYTHRFYPARDTGKVAEKLRTLYGAATFSHVGHVQPNLLWRSQRPVDGWQVILWLPFGEDHCVVSVS